MRVKLSEVLFRDAGVELGGTFSKSWKSDDRREALVEADMDLRFVIVTMLRGSQEGRAIWVPFEGVESMRPAQTAKPLESEPIVAELGKKR